MNRFLFVFVVSFLLLSAAYAEVPNDAAAVGTLFPFSVEGTHLDRFWTSAEPRPAGAGGQISVHGDVFADADGKTVRLWGTNLPFDANFPRKEDAAHLAERLRNFGVNCVRLHFVDTRIWGKYEAQFGHRRMDEERLDRLDWFIAKLKECGIYVNMNLHVGRTLDARDGNFPDVKRLPNMQKGVDNYMPEMVELQKEYARNLLTHVNPYTKMAYTDDPCVACIEINNENSIVSNWNTGELDDLPEFYDSELQKRWIDWLRKRYDSTDTLRKAWGGVEEPTGEEMIPDRSFTDAETFRKSPWKLEKDAQTTAEVSLNETNQTLNCCVTQPGKGGWNPQFYLTNATVREGIPYRVQFRIRSTVEGKSIFYFMENHPEWRSEMHTFEVKNEWSNVDFLIVPKFSDSNVRLGFAHLEGNVEIDDFSVRSGGILGLHPGESLENASVRTVKNRSQNVTLSQKRDYQDFLLDLERDYWLEMFHFVRDELHAHAPIAGTQLQYGSAHAQAELDFCDIHAYWNHPSWPHTAWDANDWFVGNQNFVNTMGFNGCILGLSSLRVLGKPFTLSEYNHPYPNFYAAEGFPIAACIGAFQNWSGIYSYCWAHNETHRDGNSYFDLCENSAHLVHQPACVHLFVRGDVKNVLELKNPPVYITEMNIVQEYNSCAERFGTYHRPYENLGRVYHYSLDRYCGMRLPDLKIPHPPTDAHQAANTVPGWVSDPLCNTKENNVHKIVSPTEELLWNGENPEKCYFLADTPRTKIFTGFIADRTFQFRDGTCFQPGKTILDWATISLTQMTENHWLLAATGVMKNTNATYCSYGETEDVKDLCTLNDVRLTSPERGKMPRLCESISGKIQIPVPAGASLNVYPLDGNASRLAPLPTHRISQTCVEFEIGTENTLWYEIEILIQ